MRSTVSIDDNPLEEHTVKAFLMSPDTVQTTEAAFATALRGLDGPTDVRYLRIPMSHDQSPTEGFIDELLTTFTHLSQNTDPIVFSGGMGVGRTSLAMAMAVLYRQICQRGDVPRVHAAVVEPNAAVLHLMQQLDRGMLPSVIRSYGRGFSGYRLAHPAPARR